MTNTGAFITNKIYIHNYFRRKNYLIKLNYKLLENIHLNSIFLILLINYTF